MLTIMGLTWFILLFLGCPFTVVTIITFLIIAFLFFPNLDLIVMVQQMLTGISPPVLVCVPMFIMAANIITSGKSAGKLINLIRAFLGHLYGGLPIVTNVACTAFGAVSGSTQATVAAIGGTMQPMLKKAGYSDAFTLGLIINSSDMAFLIPPSIGLVVYSVVTGTSVGKLFLAGVFPGIVMCILMSLYCYFYSRFNKIGLYPKANWEEKILAFRESIWIFGFPVIILGGIYGGIFSPTEAAATSVLYAIFLEVIINKSLTLEKFIDITLSTALVTAVVFIMIGAGQAIAWLLSYSGISKIIVTTLFGNNPSALKVIIIINICYFVACMFVSPMVAIYILSPLFAPYVAEAGIDKVFMGVLIIMQAAIGSATPPFGCDIFTAMMIFKKSYFETIRLSWALVLSLLSAVVLVIIFPDLALFLPQQAFGG